MKRILSALLLFTSLFAHAQPGIFPTARVKDSLRLTNLKPAALGSLRSSPPLFFGSYTWDTINNVNRWSQYDIYNEGIQGNATVKHYLRFRSKATGIYPVTMNSDGTVNFGNGLSCSANGTLYSANLTMNFLSNHNTLKFNFTNATGPLSVDGILARFKSAAENGHGSKILEVIGDASQPVLNGFAAGTVASGTNTPSYNAQLDISSVGKGQLPPRMNTAQRDGIPKRIAIVTLTNPGAGFTFYYPKVYAFSPVGGLNARLSVTPGFVSGGVSGLVLYYGGTGFSAGGSLVFDTTGTGATAMPAGTYTVTTDTIPESLTIYNTDSMCYEFYRRSSMSWISMCGGAGSGDRIATDTTSLSNRINNAYTTTDTLDAYTIVHCKPNGLCDTIRQVPAYDVYIANLSQSSTDDPVVTVLENTIGNMVWGYSDVGIYTCTSSGAFLDMEKITFPYYDNSKGNDRNSYSFVSSDSDTLFLKVRQNGILSDDVMTNWTVEIRRYH